MAEANPLLADFARYAAIIRSRLDSIPFDPTTETADAVQVERGVVLASAVKGTPPSIFPSPGTPGEGQGEGHFSLKSKTDPHPNPLPKCREKENENSPVDRLIELAYSHRLPEIAVIDAGRHDRAVYLPLLVYAWLVSFRVRYETLDPATFGRWDEALRTCSDLLEARLVHIAISETTNHAANGENLAEAAWSALALHIAGKVFIRDAWTDLAADTFGRLSRAQQANGAFLLAGAGDNPEPTWYHELTILHAAASYAVQAEDRTAARTVSKSTAYVLNEIQPDHATNQPWGLFAFIWDASARPLADQLLHSAELQSPSGRDGVSLILLADALYCLRLFL